MALFRVWGEQITEQLKSGKLLIRQTRGGWIITRDPQEDAAPPVARTYKDRIARMIFDDRKELLMLCNAMNGAH